MDGCLTRLGMAVFLFLVFPAITFADKVNNEWLSTTRSLSMGNVGIASADDPSTAMFYNPAALARKKKTTIEFFNPQLEAGTGVFKAGGGGANNYGKHISLGKVAPLLLNSKNTPSYLGASLYPNIHAQNFNFGILMRAEGGAFASADNSVTYRSRYLLMPTMGISIALLGGRLKIGAAARMIQITENDETVYKLTNIGYRQDPAEGFGIGLDGGALLSIPMFALPTIGFVARNIGDTNFTGSAPVGVGTGTVTRHERIKMTYDGAFAIFPKLGKKSQITLAADFRDIQNHFSVASPRRLNVGIELDLNRTFYLRAGYGRGYWTAGIGLGSRYGNLDIGTYAEELHVRRFTDREDRRISIRYGAKF